MRHKKKKSDLPSGESLLNITSILKNAGCGTFGKYRVVRLLGQGGMGYVFLALDPDLNRHVAIKIINRENVTPDDFQRFTGEAKSLAQLSSPQIVRIYGFHPRPENSYLVMEYVEGRTLDQEIQEGGRQTLQSILNCAAQTLSGLGAAHAAGILHRDIKPANILHSDDGFHKLADFGLARKVEPNIQKDGSTQIMGTLRYMAPEIVSGKPATIQSDIFALGAALYEYACGAPLFPGDNSMQITVAIMSKHLPQLAIARPDLPPELSVWLGRMVASKLEDRFASAAAARAELEALAQKWRMRASSAQRLSINARIRSIFTGQSLHMKTAMASSAIACSACVCLYFMILLPAANSHWEAWREDWAAYAKAVASQIDGDLHSTFPDAQPYDQDVYKQIRSKLDDFRLINPFVESAYTMIKTDDPAIIKTLVVSTYVRDWNGDGIIDSSEQPEEFGTPYNVDFMSDAALVDGFEKSSADSKVTWYSGNPILSVYAPLRKRNGQIVGALGVDVNVPHLLQRIQTLKQNVFLILAAIVAAAGAAGYLAARLILRPYSKLIGNIQTMSANSQSFPDNPAAQSKNELKILSNHIVAIRGVSARHAAVFDAYQRHLMYDIAAQVSTHATGTKVRNDGRCTALAMDVGPILTQCSTLDGLDFLRDVSPWIATAIIDAGCMTYKFQDNCLTLFFLDRDNCRQEAQALQAAMQIRLNVFTLWTKLHAPQVIGGIGIHTADGTPTPGDPDAPVECAQVAAALAAATQRQGTTLLVSECTCQMADKNFNGVRVILQLPDETKPRAAYALRVHGTL